MFKNKTILITGGTGSLGQALTKRLLEMDANTIRIFSRNESKQIEMESDFDDKKLRFFVGDIRDSERLFTALEDVELPLNDPAVNCPVEELNVRFVPLFGARSPVAAVVKRTLHAVSVDSSATVTVVATEAVPVKSAVIVPAAKLPDPSRRTKASPVLAVADATLIVMFPATPSPLVSSSIKILSPSGLFPMSPL